MSTVEVFEPYQRVMVVSPHPDDAELGVGGTVGLMTKMGKEVFYVIATSGNRGGRDTDMTADYLERARQEEQRAAAAVLGVREVVFLGFGDGDLQDDHTCRRALVREIRRLKPDIIFTTDPFRSTFYIHRDHRMTGLLTIDAAFPYARDRLHYPEHLTEGLSVHNVEEVYFWGTERPDTFINVGETVELRARAMLAHTSQMIDRIKEVGGEDNFIKDMTRWARRASRTYNLSFPYAEAFRRFGIRNAWRGSEDLED